MLRLCLLLCLMALSVVPLTAQTPEPLPLPLPGEPTGLQYERSAEDIETIAALDAELRAAAATLDLRAPSHVQMPLTLRVGIVNTSLYINNCTRWVQDGMPILRVEEIDFKEYVKNVLPNEWVWSWHPESLRAGAVAAKMFAWWRYNILEQYPQYRPQGVHVVNNVCDQVYIPGSARDTTNAAVDATWPTRMTDSERVVEIHYLAWDWQCADALARNGGGWFRCMGQNESNQLANAGWSHTDILQRYYTPVQFTQTQAMPQKVNVLLNPNFNSGTQNWFVIGDVGGYTTEGGVFRYYRPTESVNPPQLYQDADVIANANTPFQLRLLLGNPSAVDKQVRVRIRSIASASGSVDCVFTVEAGKPLRQYVVVGSNPTAWTGVRVMVSLISADGIDGLQVDKVRLRLLPNADLSVPCQTPRPGAPVITSPTYDQAVRSPFNVSLTPGATNHVTGYSPSWQVQVDDQPDFSSPFYDNAASLSTETTLPVATSSGTWYVRARQYDGVATFSLWSAPVRFSVATQPAKPILVAPVGDVPAQNQSFVWMASNLADEYIIVVKDPTGTVVYRASNTPAGWGCTTESCIVPLSSTGFAFAADTPYRWRVIARNSTGRGASAFTAFRLVEFALRRQP